MLAVIVLIRLADRIQSSTDGHGPYVNAVEKMFGCVIEYAMLVKINGDDNGGQKALQPGQLR